MTMITNIQLTNAPFMREAESYMKAHDFLRADKCKVREWIRQAIGDRFGVAIKMTEWVYEIYENLLLDWIRERSMTEREVTTK